MFPSQPSVAYTVGGSTNVGLLPSAAVTSASAIKGLYFYQRQQEKSCPVLVSETAEQVAGTRCAVSDLLKAALHDAPTDGKLLWRLARATKEDAEVDGRPSAEKTAMLREGFGYAAEALKHAPNESGAHKWYCARRPPDAAEPRGL